MEDQESKMKTDAKPIPEKRDHSMEEGTGMGAIWDIRRFDRMLEEEKAKLRSESKT
jgi:hypothetical protein